MIQISSLRHNVLLVVLTSAVFVPAQVFAGKSVSSPYVSEGELGIETKTEVAVDGDDDVSGTWEQSLEIEYGLTSFLSVEAGIEFEDEPGDDVKTGALEVESKIQFTEKGAYFIDSGMKFKYKHNTATGADEIGAKLLLAKKTGKVGNVANFEIKKEVGDDSADHEKYGFAWKSKYEYSEMLNPGFEYYADFSDTTGEYEDQSHRIGPVLYGDMSDNFGYEFGVLAGISDAAPDATIKLNLEYEF